jgi:hypothetical protein
MIRRIAVYSRASVVWGATFWCLISIHDVQAQESERVWTSSNGRKSVTGSLLDFEARKRTATLRLNNGETLVISAKNLSRKDQHYLRDFLKKRCENSTPADLKQDERVAAKELKRGIGPHQPTSEGSKARESNMYGIRWVTDIPAALRLAQGNESPTDDRPVMWFRVLGDLSGFM